MESMMAMLIDRPYVVAFLVTFLVISGAERGLSRTLFWLVSGTFIGWLAEFSSISNGFPFGFYTYYHEHFPRELWIGGIPFFASLSFSFLTYFGFSLASTFLSPLRRQGSELERVEDLQVTTSVGVLLLAAVLTTWMDLVTDPVSHLGKYWFLGDLYLYHTEGLHFHVPITNYLGWLFTSVCIVFVNQRFDAWLSPREDGAPLGFKLPFKPLWTVGTCVGNFLFMLGITVYLMGSPDVPDSVPLVQMLISGIVLSSLFTLFSVVMIRRAMQRG